MISGVPLKTAVFSLSTRHLLKSLMTKSWGEKKGENLSGTQILLFMSPGLNSSLLSRNPYPGKERRSALKEKPRGTTAAFCCSLSAAFKDLWSVNKGTGMMRNDGVCGEEKRETGIQGYVNM